MGRKQGMHREEIKAAIRMKGDTLAGLSRAWGYDPCAVSMTLMKPWPEVEARIANYLGMTPRTIWPLRYLPDGTPRQGRPIASNENNITPFPCRNNQLEDAA